MARKTKAAARRSKTPAPAKPKFTIVRDALPTDAGFIGHFDQVLVKDSKGNESLMKRNEAA